MIIWGRSEACKRKGRKSKISKKHSTPLDLLTVPHQQRWETQPASGAAGKEGAACDRREGQQKDASISSF